MIRRPPFLILVLFAFLFTKRKHRVKIFLSLVDREAKNARGCAFTFFWIGATSYTMTKGPHKKNTPYDSTRSRHKGANSDANRDEDNSGTPLTGAHAVDEAETKTTSKSTPANTAGAHISDSEECNPPTSSQSVQQLLASHPVGNPFWGGHDHTDDYSVDTADSAQDLVGFHV